MPSASGPRVRYPQGILTAIGGPRGARARPAGRRPARARLAPVVLLLGLPLLVAALRQSACAAGGWSGPEPVWRQCAAPLYSSLGDAGAGRGLLAYLAGDVPLEVPVVPAAVTTLLASLAPGQGLTQQRGVLVLWALLAAVVLAVLVVLVGTVRGTPGADPVALALSPVLALSVLLSTDLVPAALATAAVWAWSRRRPGLAGALAGLAVLGGRPALVVLLAMAVLPPAGVRAATRRLLGAAALTVVLVVGPVAALDLGLLVRPVTAWWTGGSGVGSPWLLPTLAGRPLDATHVAVVGLLGTLLAAGLVLLLASRRPAPPVARVSLVGLVVVLVTGPVLPVHAAVWLVPFVALAGVPWRDHLVWAGAEAVHAVAWYSWLAARSDPTHGLPAGWYAAALALRLLALGRLAWVVTGGVSWEAPPRAGTLERLPSEPVDEPRADVGGVAYPPVTERP